MTEPHRLERMMNPASIAYVGASPREESVGYRMITSGKDGGFGGDIRLVTPNYGCILGIDTQERLSDLDLVPDLVIAGVGGHRVETVSDDAIEVGAGGVVVFDTCPDEAGSLQRIRDKAAEANMPVNGGNGMGFLNLTHGCHASFYDAGHLTPGGITLIAHSGSVFTVLSLNDPRFRFNYVISAGQEISTTVDEYVDYALDQPETKVLALFMEATRDPSAFEAALSKAADRYIPVVVTKVGRTVESARLARSHTGAMAGSDAAYEALFTTYGAVRVETVDELMNAAMLLERDRIPGPGGLGVVTDSGGLRESLIDRSERIGVPLAELTEDTQHKLAAGLPPGLAVSNPLDCAGQMTPDFSLAFRRGLEVMSEAPEVAVLGYEFDGRDDFTYREGLEGLGSDLADMTTKPVFVFSSFAQTNNRDLGRRYADAGVPTVNGQDQMLLGVRNLFRYRDRPLPDAERLTAPDPALVDKWEKRVAAGRLAERESLAMMASFGVPTVHSIVASDLDAAIAATEVVGYPAVMKSDAEGLDHKTDAGAVILDITSSEDGIATYEHLEGLGPDVIVQEMAPRGVELAFGCVRDPEFGPVVMVSAGGIMIELLNDRAVALAPFGVTMASHLIDQLRIRPLLDDYRGSIPVDMDALIGALVDFSAMCAAVKGFSEIDVNPVIASPSGVMAVDALVV